mmetsp:Transcript_31838/g.75829  ORF Transcript_31838/g.75829 Transcript_31838/m.75829 type:complete len:335 (-) Transcript_31838:71-1075(-)
MAQVQRSCEFSLVKQANGRYGLQGGVEPVTPDSRYDLKLSEERDTASPSIRRMRFRSGGLSMTGHLRQPRDVASYSYEENAEAPVPEQLRQKLLAIGSSFASLGKQVDADARRRKELEAKRCQELLVFLGKLEHELTDEAQNRETELVELRQAVERRLNQMIEDVQKRVSARFSGLIGEVEALADRCGNLELGIQQFKGEVPSQLQVELTYLKEAMQQLLADAAREQQRSSEQDAGFLLRMEEGRYAVDAEMQKELVRLERRGEALQELIDQFAFAQEDADIAQQRAVVLDQMAELRRQLSAEVALREAADDEVVQAINDYTATLHRSLSATNS